MLGQQHRTSIEHQNPDRLCLFPGETVDLLRAVAAVHTGADDNDVEWRAARVNRLVPTITDVSADQIHAEGSLLDSHKSPHTMLPKCSLALRAVPFQAKSGPYDRRRRHQDALLKR